ncbi:MAG: hypothetical protein JSR82_05965 [Verrucomicrobia bacterium]|nr:hypothetical protein [Verrucomicrobiota bacterium]
MKALLTLAVLGLGLPGCTTAMAQRAENSDGLFDFLFARPRTELALPVERISSSGGTVETAHVNVYGREAYVTGLIGRGFHEAAIGSHLDVEVINPRGKIAQSQVVNFLPAQIPSGRRGNSYSRYATRLQAIPPPGSSLRVTFHNDAKSMCAFAALVDRMAR